MAENFLTREPVHRYEDGIFETATINLKYPLSGRTPGSMQQVSQASEFSCKGLSTTIPYFIIKTLWGTEEAEFLAKLNFIQKVQSINSLVLECLRNCPQRTAFLNPSFPLSSFKWSATWKRSKVEGNWKRAASVAVTAAGVIQRSSLTGSFRLWLLRKRFRLLSFHFWLWVCLFYFRIKWTELL